MLPITDTKVAGPVATASNGLVEEKDSNVEDIAHDTGSQSSHNSDRQSDEDTNGAHNGNINLASTIETVKQDQEYSITTNGKEPPEVGGGGENGSEEGVDEEDGEDEDDEDNEDDEDECEPALKYDLLGGSVPQLLEKDSASSLAVSEKYLAIGTHAGIIHVLDYAGLRVKSYRPHSASVIDMCFDTTAEFVGSASVDGQIIIHSLTDPESYAFDMKRPMRTISLEPNFSKRGTGAFVCGGMAGNLIMYEKGWLGHKEIVLHTGEGPIWTTRWRGNLIAWANDLGVKIYDTSSQTRITFIDRPPDSPRADLFKCTLHWEDDSTLLIAWADIIKVARIRSRPKPSVAQGGTSEKVLPPLMAEITALFGIEGMISGIVPYPVESFQTRDVSSQTSITSFLTLVYTPPDTFKDEATDDRRQQARKLAERPELRIISRSGEETSSDVLGVSGYQTCGCNDYVLAVVPTEGSTSKSYIVLNPKTVIIVKPRDRKDHITWLVERTRYEEALEQLELVPDEGVDAAEIGQRYIEYLVNEHEYTKAARMFPKVLGHDPKKWEDWIFIFAQKDQLQVIIPYIPTETPKLTRVVYDMILAHFLAHDRKALLQTIRDWPNTIYDINAVLVAVQSELQRTSPSSPDATILMECPAELYLSNRQPGKSLPYVLRLRRPNVFNLIRDNNLHTDVQDQVLLLMEFDQELTKHKREAGEDVPLRSPAISLLVDHTYSIPIPRVVQQLQSRPYFLYLYLDSLFEKDPHLASDFADHQVELYAEFSPNRLIDFLAQATITVLKGLTMSAKTEIMYQKMVFLLGRMGNNKTALTLIIERLGDVNRAIDFAKEQNDEDLWEDLLRYSETRPAFIRGLLENVGAEINPILLIRRIKNGLEIPGLKEALIKILQAFNLQISLLEGCQTILEGDCATLAKKLQKDQTKGFYETARMQCPICSLPLQQGAANSTVFFLCRHIVHLSCVSGGEGLSRHHDPILSTTQDPTQDLSGKIAFAAMVRGRVNQGCPVCHRRDEGDRTYLYTPFVY